MMGRSGYTEDCDFDNWANIRWRGVVASSIRGKRGQAFLRDLIAALDALPEPKLYPNELQCRDGVCAMGSVGLQRGVDLSKIDPEDSERIARIFDIAEPLVREIEWENDEGGILQETPERRWTRMRAWAVRNLKEPAQ